MLGGIEPCSFIDFPGRVAAVLFLRGCNLQCRYCHNPQLIPRTGAGGGPDDGTLEFLQKRRGLLGGVVVTGGEPTLQARLPVLLEAVRSMGFAVKLDTNGTRPEVVGRLIAERLLEYAAVDVKIAPGPGSRWLCGMETQADTALETLGRLVGAGIPCEARTTVAAGVHDLEGLRVLARKLAGAGVRLWRLQPVEDTTVLDPSVPWRPPAPEILSGAVAAAASLGITVPGPGAGPRPRGAP